jgi:DnaJ-class molecular chaperone
MNYEECISFMDIQFNSKNIQENLESLEDKYLLLCKKYHPDNPKTGDETLFDKLQQSYETIKTKIQNDYSMDGSVFFLRCTLRELYTGCKKSINYHTYIGNTIILPGTLDGQNILVNMYDGQNLMGQYPVKILEINDTMFKREGNNLLITLNISEEQAKYGRPIKISVFGDHIVEIPVKINASDQKYILPGFGMPIYGTDNYGDLIVSYRVVFS